MYFLLFLKKAHVGGEFFILHVFFLSIIAISQVFFWYYFLIVLGDLLLTQLHGQNRCWDKFKEDFPVNDLTDAQTPRWYLGTQIPQGKTFNNLETTDTVHKPLTSTLMLPTPHHPGTVGLRSFRKQKNPTPSLADNNGGNTAASKSNFHNSRFDSAV